MGETELAQQVRELSGKLEKADYTIKQLLRQSVLTHDFVKLLRSKHHSMGDILNKVVDEIIAENMQANSTVLYLVNDNKLIVRAADGISATEKKTIKIGRAHV